MYENLKPCPFCSVAPVLSTTNGGKYYYVSCANPKCKAHATTHINSSKMWVIDTWNDRWIAKPKIRSWLDELAIWFYERRFGK